MTKSDGSILIQTKIDVNQAEKDLAKLKKAIGETESDIADMEKERATAEEKSVFSAQELDAEKAKLEEMKKVLQEIQATAKDTSLSDSVRAEAQAQIPIQKTEISDQQIRVRMLQSEFDKLHNSVERYDEKLRQANKKLERQKEEAGALIKEINSVSKASLKMAEAQERAEKSLGKFSSRMREVVRSALVFTLISQSLAKFREWMGKVIKTNDEATAAIARLKGALLTMAQPLVSIIIPAFTVFVNLLASVISKIAKFVAAIFRTTASDAAKAAEALYEEQQALDAVGSSAKKSSQNLAAFDEINTLSSESSTSSESTLGEIAPDFSGVTDSSWLDTELGNVAGKVAAALMLGGVALVAIGAATGSLATVIAGLTLLNAGISIGEDTGVFTSWAEALGLDSVTQYIAIALLLGGIAIVAVGAATGSLTTVLAGLGLLGSGIALAEGSEEVQSWVEKLGLNSVNEFIADALILGGIAIIAIGAMMGNILMVIAGLGLIGGAVVYADEETKASWIETLGLDSVFDYVTAAMQLAGIALIAIGAAMGNIALVIAGGVILGLGIAADAIGEETLKDWWEVLKLTTIQQWVGAALLLFGIALIAIGACMGNILMIIAGAGMLAVGTITSASEGNLKDWVTTLGLEKVAGWVTAGLLLVGLALVVFGIFTGNIMMILAGAGMLGAGIAIGVTSGTFSSWLDVIISAFTGFKEKILNVFGELWGGMKSIINSILGGVEWLANKVVGGINTVIGALNRINFDIPSWLGGGSFGFNIKKLSTVSIPRLATGSVIPPNREFMAVLGDNKTEHEVVSPLSTMKQAFLEAMQESGGMGGGTYTFVVNLDGKELARNQVKHINNMTIAAGKPVLLF